MLCNRSGGLDSFFLVKERATLTIEDLSKKTNDVSRPVDTAKTPAGQLASMEWEKGSGSNNVTPKSLTYYETKSTPNTNGLGTTETTYEHVVTGFGAIDAASESGSVKYVVNVEAGGILNLKGGMITTAANLSNDGHVIFSQGTVKIEGGYVTNGNGGGWGGGLCVTGAKASLEMTGGVVAGNKAASGGGIYADRGATLKLTGGIISGNATYGEAVGLGGGILVSGGSVTVSGGYITNNKYARYCGIDGQGDHGGGGLAANNGTHVIISGGQITGNYSDEAGGGVYVTNLGQQSMAWLDITGGNIASNVSYKSEGAGIRVGQKVDAMISGASKDSPVYITNNHCMSRFDWGGGGVFVQGDSDNDASNAGRLFVYSSYISSNTAGGYGGGVAVCPTGKTLVTNTEGTAIFGNADAQNANSYDKNDNNGNPHLSGGGHKKTQDKYAYNSVDKNGEHVFRDSGHADFFLAAEGHITPVAVVTGKMLGDIDAKYSGSIELTDRITIPANGVAQVKNSIGLTSGVSATDNTATEAVQKNATTFITGNYSWNHGGGIMSNGDLYLGVPADTYVYPSLKLKATKALKMKNKQTEESIALAKDQFSFSVYRKDSDGATEPSWNDKTFNSGGCTLVGTAKNDADGNITFDLGEQFIDKTVEANKITYYLVENAGNDLDITYDPAVYKIVVTVRDNQTLLMKVPSRENPNSDVPLYVHNYTITSVSPGDSTNSLEKDDQGYYSINGPGGEKTFTNKYTPYTSTGTWTPKVTKVVKGGEMKEFTLEFANNADFKDATTVKTDPKGEILTAADGKKSQTRSFDEIEYKLDQLDKLKTDSTGRGASKTFTYYVREKGESSTYPHYKFDQSVYRFKVVATDNTKGRIDCAVTYMKGTVDSDGNWKADVDAEEQNLTDTSNPTFTNTYSTSLPLSGMSGVTLTYLAGAAVLCAAAAWMHVRRKASAKGGERRE
ncbi:FctA domain-containing protein [Collinsella aerofaciens]